MSALSKCRRGILFSGPLVLALLAGRKTVTRRLDKSWLKLKTGDLLYVKETIRRAESTPSRHPGGDDTVDSAVFAADGAPTLLDSWGWQRDVLPSIHMPRGLARIFLRVTEAPRLERVEDITEEDAKREGVEPFEYDPEGDCWTARRDVHRSAFEYIWGDLHGWTGPQAFSENPEVVRIAFERVEGE